LEKLMKKALVTGGCGFVGYELTKQLINNGFDVDVIDNLSIGKESKDVTSIGANFLGGDIRAMENIPDKKYDYIFHLAALSRIQPSFVNPNTTFSVNVDGTRQVLEYVRRNGGKLIYAGSSSRHHNPELSPYAMSKYLGEQLCALYRRVYDVNVEITRFYNVYGQGELIDSHMAAVIGIFRKNVKEDKPLLIHGDGEQRRDFTHIDDICDGLRMIAESDIHHSEGWELGTGKNYSLNEVFNMFKERFQNIQKQHVENVKGNYRETIRLNDKALDELGWKPTDKLKGYINSL
jgi:UDP-glucose 4-epimerase